MAEERLIDANALREHIKSYAGMFTDELGFVVRLEAVIGGIDFAPTVDAVEVVRCKDCKHRRDDEDYASGHYCVKRPSNGGYFCEDNDFCSYGERKDNG